MIQTLTLTDFRNHTFTRVRTDGALAVVLTGPNGGGKTSLLEALSLLSGNGGLRGATPAEIARMDGGAAHPPQSKDCVGTPAAGWAVMAELSNDSEISITWTAAENKKKARINNDAVSLSKLIDALRMVWLTPREDRVFIDAASERRAFFDRLVSGFTPHHAGHVFRLAKLLSERGFALKSGAGDQWLAPIEHQIADIAIRVARARDDFVDRINGLLRPVNYVLSVNGMVEDAVASGTDPAALAREYAEYLARNRALVADKMSIDGPHRADFSMFDSALNRPVAQTSTGQQKAALLRLVIAHAKLLRENFGGPTLVLLDEVAAHLDANARKTLFTELADAGAQVWMTGLDAAAFSDVADAKFIHCENGEICNN